MTRLSAVSRAALASSLCAAGVCTAQPAALDELGVAERNQRLVTAVRDAGYRCEELVDAMPAQAAMPAWRVVCNDALVYLASTSEVDGSLHVEPLPYRDPVGPPVNEPREPAEPPVRPPER